MHPPPPRFCWVGRRGELPTKFSKREGLGRPTFRGWLLAFARDSVTRKNKDKFIDDEKELLEIFNNYYINVVEKTSGKPVENSFKNCDDNFKAVFKIIKKYEKHQS